MEDEFSGAFAVSFREFMSQEMFSFAATLAFLPHQKNARSSGVRQGEYLGCCQPLLSPQLCVRWGGVKVLDVSWVG